MRTLAALALMFVALGCGGGSDPIEGKWASGTNDLEFSAGRYTYTHIALTSDHRSLEQVETGAYSADGARVTLTPEKWSCDGAAPAATYAYSFTGDGLLMDDGTRVLVFSPDVPDYGQPTIGCFNADGTFLAHPVGPAK